MRSEVVVASLFAVVLLGCGSLDNSRVDNDEKHWFRGNLHTHSLWQGGDEYPEMIIRWYRQNGYDFIALSDHNTIAEGERWITVEGKGRSAFESYLDRFGDEWVEQKTDRGGLSVRLKTYEEYRGLLEEPGRFLIIRSEEISDRFESKPVHVNATNIGEHIEPQGGGSVLEVMQNNVDAVLEQRERTGRPILPHLNHPNFKWAVTVEDLIALRGERFFEVYNGHPLVHNHGDHGHPSTERMWDIVLAQRLLRGRNVIYGLATDDAHNYHQFDSTRSNPGRGWVMVYAESLSPQALINAMEEGNFYATTGVELEELSQQNGRIRIRIRPEPGVEYVTRFIGTRKGFDSTSVALPSEPGERRTRRYSDEVGVVLAEVKGTSASYRLGGDEMYVRANIVSSKPKANSTYPGEVEEAWLQPSVPARSSTNITVSP